MRHLIFCVILCSIFFCVTGCVDDLFTDDPDFGDGKCKVTATVDFIPMSANFMQSKSPGNALGEINSLHVLLYDFETKKLLKSWNISDYTVKDESRSDADAEGGKTAEDTTRQARFTLPEDVKYGKYHLYAVANIPDLLTNSAYAGYIQTVDGLKSLPLTWDSSNVRKNAQMLGYFTKSDEIQPEDDALVLHEYAMNVHSWLRRAASKVTVAYDGSELKEGVFVYIKSVTIKDIPNQCYLGKSNNVGAADYALDCPALGKETEMPDGDSIVYYQGAEPKEFGPEYSGPRITSGSPYYGDHGKNAEALFFYENMQGAGDLMPDKRQDANGDGTLDYPGLPNDPVKYPKYRLKDSVRYGSYIEVKAHYVSINSEKMGNGSIVYRFMLGQDVKRDYNARRNCHYKLTLKLKNFANDADWHIEYVEPEPSVVTLEKYYISYLYNKKMMFPLKVKTGGHKIKSITAHIKDNRWAPFEANHWVYYYQMDKENENQWNGFLSLHKTKVTVIEAPKGEEYTYNEVYYNKDPKRGDRVYDKFGADGEYTTINSDPDDKYRVETSTTEPDCYNVYLPMYTRAKQMVIVTGYTGNNPYVAYMRKAVVEFTVELTNGLKMHSEVPIFQVRRIVNPKGIYRSATCVDPFHVTLMRLPREEATEFESFPSEGSWKAYIVRETHNGSVTLAKTLPTSVQVGDTVFGKTGSIIDFDVKFKATPATENHYTVIRVDYHNYSCEHLIFIRQGNQPDSLYEGGALWYAENMKDSLHRADSPLEEGSLFKYGNWTQAIDAMNNKNPVSAEKPYWVSVEPEDFKLYPADGFDLAGAAPGAKKVPWSGIWKGTGFVDVDNMRVATYEDYKGIYDRSYMEQGYGVLYGDDATKVAVDINDAYGYDYKNKKGRGMRGCFAYNSNTGKNLFFPIGASGYGHRKYKGSDATDKAEIASGILRYSTGRHTYYGLYNPWGNPQEPTNRPLFHDIFRRPGAIYYIRSAVDGKLGWDINYFTFDFNSIEIGSVNNGRDACFIRCIKTN